jgi:hypothetical protein
MGEPDGSGPEEHDFANPNPDLPWPQHPVPVPRSIPIPRPVPVPVPYGISGTDEPDNTEET